jgi:mRNA-degrading endonuclease toxin of MazEF toxin-antitoxin module
MNRGDVILVRFPHPSGMRGKKRPAVVVQSDAYNQAVRTIVVAEVTKNLAMARDPACLFIDLNTPEGRATGLKRDSVLSCLLLATIDGDRVDQIIGALSASMRDSLNDCLKAALGVP